MCNEPRRPREPHGNKLPWAYWCLLALMLVVLGGCASNKRSTTITGPDGKPVTVVEDMSDSAVFHQAQATGFAARRPIAELKFPKGGEVPPGMEFIVWGPNGNTTVAQYAEPWLEAFKHGSGILGMGLLGYIMGYGDNFQRPAPTVVTQPQPLVVKPEIVKPEVVMVPGQ